MDAPIYGGGTQGEKGSDGTPPEQPFATLVATFQRAVNAPIPDSLEERKAHLEHYLQDILQHDLAADSTLVGIRAASSRGEDPISWVQFADSVRTVVRQAPSSSSEDAKDDDCKKALVKGLAEITVGAAIGGPLGAIGGFVLGVVELAVEC